MLNKVIKISSLVLVLGTAGVSADNWSNRQVYYSEAERPIDSRQTQWVTPYNYQDQTSPYYEGQYRNAGDRGYYYSSQDRGMDDQSQRRYYSKQQENQDTDDQNNEGKSGYYYQGRGQGSYFQEQNEDTSDKSIKSQAKDVLSNYKDIQVSSDNGKVTLKGTVKTDEDRNQAAKAVRGIPGVKNIDNQLEVNKKSSD